MITIRELLETQTRFRKKYRIADDHVLYVSPTNLKHVSDYKAWVYKKHPQYPGVYAARTKEELRSYPGAYITPDEVEKVYVSSRVLSPGEQPNRYYIIHHTDLDQLKDRIDKIVQILELDPSDMDKAVSDLQTMMVSDKLPSRKVLEVATLLMYFKYWPEKSVESCARIIQACPKTARKSLIKRKIYKNPADLTVTERVRMIKTTKILYPNLNITFLLKRFKLHSNMILTYIIDGFFDDIFDGKTQEDWISFYGTGILRMHPEIRELMNEKLLKKQ